jgi:hypothetical protein
MSDPLDALEAELTAKVAAKEKPEIQRDPFEEKYEALKTKLAADEKARAGTPPSTPGHPSEWMQRQMANNPPIPEPKPSFAGELGTELLNNAKAIPAGFNDAFSAGLIPAIQEAPGGSMAPGTYQRTMEAGPVGAAIGQTAGLGLSAGAGLLKPIGQLAGTVARAVRGAVAVGQLGERVIGGAIAGGGYAATDAAFRGGNPDQVFDAGMTGAALGGGIPAVAGVAGEVGSSANQAATNSVRRHEERAAQKLLDEARASAAAKAEKSLTGVEKGAASGAVELPATQEILDEGGVNVPASQKVARAAERQGLTEELTGPIPKFAQKVKSEREAVGKELDRYVAMDKGPKAGPPTAGVPVPAVVGSLERLRSQSAPGSEAYKAITSKMESIMADYGEGQSNIGARGVPTIRIWQLHDLAVDASNKGYASSALKASEASKLNRQISMALREPLYEEINNVMARNPSYGNPERFAALRTRYRDLSALSEIGEAATLRVSNQKHGLFHKLASMENMVKLAASASAGGSTHYLSGGNNAMTAMASALPYAPTAVRVTDTAIAKLINAARSGYPAHMYQAAAEQLGASPELATQIWTQFGAPAAAVTLPGNGARDSVPAPQTQPAPQSPNQPSP